MCVGISQGSLHSRAPLSIDARGEQKRLDQTLLLMRRVGLQENDTANLVRAMRCFNAAHRQGYAKV